MVEESELYTAPAVRVPLLRRGQVGLEDSCEILDVHRRLLAFLLRQAVFLRQLPKDLQKRRKRYLASDLQ
jgi:hypothetical protein